MESIKIAKNGQWSLHKSPDLISEFETSPDMDMMSYRRHSLDGSLPQDHGNQGELHNVGNVRAPRQNSKSKMDAKVPNPIKSALRERKPSLT